MQFLSSFTRTLADSLYSKLRNTPINQEQLDYRYGHS